MAARGPRCPTSSTSPRRDPLSQGTNYLAVHWQRGGTHAESAQELTRGCPTSCRLVAHYVTDVTAWPEVTLPSGDNPGTLVSTQGEVYGDPTNSMGAVTFSQLKWHAGNWLAWNNQTVYAGYAPYCNTDVSVAPVYSSYNWGPAGSHGC